MIGILSYGLGNVSSFLNIYDELNIPAIKVNTVNDLKNVTHIILPGVGHFDFAIKKFVESGLKEEVQKLVLVEKTPILGVCVGMQIMAKSSQEGKEGGLNWLPGNVVSLRELVDDDDYILPHMGWNVVQLKNGPNPLINGDRSVHEFYFLHSYAFYSDENSCVKATAKYGVVFDVMVSNQNIFGVQFHPEKSHKSGLTLLKNFASL